MAIVRNDMSIKIHNEAGLTGLHVYVDLQKRRRNERHASFCARREGEIVATHVGDLAIRVPLCDSRVRTEFLDGSNNIYLGNSTFVNTVRCTCLRQDTVSISTRKLSTDGC